jgi:acetyltransferase-like isoleucine patch superfamily enzyme
MSTGDRLKRAVEPFMPSFAKALVKKFYYCLRRTWFRYRNIRKGRFVEFGYRFRFDCSPFHKAYIGSRSIVEDFNVWNTDQGDITVGDNCWFGLNNIVMGPIEIGDKLSTGPYVKFVGPRHPVPGMEDSKRDKTVIGNSVWISTGAIILFGVRIGDNAVISAGSVVTKDVPEGGFAGGNPARDLSAIVKPRWQS